MKLVARVRLAVLAATVAACATAGADGPDGIDIRHVDLALTVTPGQPIVAGEQTLAFAVRAPARTLRFDAGRLDVRAASIDGEPVEISWPAEGSGVTGATVTAPDALRPDTEYRLRLDYETTPKRGLVNGPELMASAYFACDWMLCNQRDFSDRFTMDVALDAPTSLMTLGPGRLVGHRARTDGRTVWRWRTEEAFPAYVYAFAAGDLRVIPLDTPCATEFMVLTPDNADGLAEAFAPTCDMAQFFAAKAGTALPPQSYAQLFVPDKRVAQEAVSHAIIGGTFLKPILTDPQEDWVIAHELAHQWWGNRVTAASLTEFWLNEGLVTYMVAAWKEERWGREAYEREITLNRRRWERGIERFRDVPLTFDGDYPSNGVRQSFQYAKGAVFLHELRAVVGEEAFWSGLATFTQQNMGRPVTSDVFERAIQAKTVVDLEPMFEVWVHGFDQLEVPSKTTS